MQADTMLAGGRLRVSLPASRAQHFPPAVINAFHDKYPDIHCQFESSHQHVDPVSSPFDLALRFGEQPDH